MKMTKSGFTLAEVLITLAIIGVIAAISVPSLIQKTNQAELITAWKKNYATISQAMDKYAFDNGSLNQSMLANQFIIKLKDNLKLIKVCDNATQSGNCWHNPNEWQSLSGTLKSQALNSDPVFASAILSNGSLILIQKSAGFTCVDTTDYNNEGHSCFQYLIDINGFKKPNTIGKDIYTAMIFKDGSTYPRNVASNSNYACTTTPTATSSDLNGWGCSAEYLFNKQ